MKKKKQTACFKSCFKTQGSNLVLFSLKVMLWEVASIMVKLNKEHPYIVTMLYYAEQEGGGWGGQDRTIFH